MTSASYAVRSPIYSTGASFGIRFLRDVSRDESLQRVRFHINQGDYFGTLSAVTRLMSDVLVAGNEKARARCVTTLKELSEDLMYLQERATISFKR